MQIDADLVRLGTDSRVAGMSSLVPDTDGNTDLSIAGQGLEGVGDIRRLEVCSAPFCARVLVEHGLEGSMRLGNLLPGMIRYALHTCSKQNAVGSGSSAIDGVAMCFFPVCLLCLRCACVCPQLKGSKYRLLCPRIIGVCCVFY